MHRIVLLVAVLVLGVNASEAQWRGKIEDVEGVPHVRNPSEPAGPLQVRTLSELWRIGGEEEEEEILGQITDVAVGDDGRTYLLDGSFSTVRVLSPEGEKLGQVGREGEGPGEWRNGRDLLTLPGGKLGIIRHMPSKIILIEEDGTPAGEFEVPNQSEMNLGLIRTADAAGGRVVLSLFEPVLEGGAIQINEALAAYDLEGNLITTYKEESRPSETPRLRVTINNPRNFSLYWTVADDGRLYVAPTFDDYRIEVFGLEGGLERVIERDYRSLRRTAEEIAQREEANEQMRAMVGGGGSEVEPYDRDVLRLFARPNGELWVWSSEGKQARPGGAIGSFDVFDREGRYLNRLNLRADFDPDRDNFLIVQDRLFVLKEALSAPTSMSQGGGGGGGQMVMVQLGNRAEDDGEEANPYGVICYALPN